MLDDDDGAVGALSNLLDELVLRVEDEHRVKSGERVPLHDFARVHVRLCSRENNQANDSDPLMVEDEEGKSDEFE